MKKDLKNFKITLSEDDSSYNHSIKIDQHFSYDLHYIRVNTFN